jgi:4-carboxymuconolactone decarboxylase
MKKLIFSMAMFAILLFIACNNTKKEQGMKESDKQISNDIFPKGEKASSDYFTGAVSVNMLVQRDENNNYTVADVKFEPSAKTNWHTHPVGQVLLVTEGQGYYQEKGKPARKLSKGDVVIIPANVEHWHGATHDSHFTHIAITNYKENVNVVWLKPVTEEEYNSLLN